MIRSHVAVNVTVKCTSELLVRVSNAVFVFQSWIQLFTMFSNTRVCCTLGIFMEIEAVCWRSSGRMRIEGLLMYACKWPQNLEVSRLFLKFYKWAKFVNLQVGHDRNQWGKAFSKVLKFVKSHPLSLLRVFALLIHSALFRRSSSVWVGAIVSARLHW